MFDGPVAPALGLNELVRHLLRRKYVLMGCALAGLLAGLLATSLIRPLYRARSSMQLQGFNENYFLRDVAPMAPMLANASPQNYVDNQLKVLLSETLARRVAARLKLEAPGTHTQPPAEPLAGRLRRLLAPLRGPRTYTVTDVQAALKVDTSMQSQVIEIFYTDIDPAVAARAVNIAVEEFVAMNREARSQAVDETASALGAQTAELRDKVQEASRELNEYAQNSGLVFSSDGRGTLGEDRMKQLEDALARAQADRVTKQSRYEAAMASPDTLPDSLATGPLRQYETDVESLKRQIAEAKTVYTPAHYKVKLLEAKLAETQRAVAAERVEIVGRLKTEYQAALGAEKRLTEADTGQLRALQAEKTRQLQYAVRERELATTQRLYDSVLEKVKAAGVASALGGTSVRVIDTAYPPQRPYSPNIPLNTALGLAFGMVGGFGMILMRSESGKFMRPGDGTLAGVPELGAILSAHDRAALEYPRRSLLTVGAEAPELGLATWQQDASLFAESFRATMASIALSSDLRRDDANGPGKFCAGVLAISSVEPAEGKSTVVSNLGVAFAETKRRVLLIDADLRKPRLHTIFGVSNDWGLSDLVQSGEPVNAAALGKMVRPTQVPGLSLLPSGPGVDGISKLLYSAALEELLAAFRKEFDLVLVDTPPARLHPDARVLARMTDGMVIVVRAKKTNREDVAQLREILARDGTPVVGTILNDCRLEAAQYKAYTNYYRPSKGLA